MRVVNLPGPITVLAASATTIVTDAQMQAASGAVCVVVEPTVDIMLVDGTGEGTAANSPFRCLAGVQTVISHRSGPLLAIALVTDSTVKVAIGCEP